MTGILDNLRDALLLTLVVVLLYILYKRLLRVLGKDAVSVPRFDILPGSEKLETTGFSCKVTLPVETTIETKVFLIDSGELLHDLTRPNLEKGEHTLKIDFREIPSGISVGIEISTNNHKIFKKLTMG